MWILLNKTDISGNLVSIHQPYSNNKLQLIQRNAQHKT